MMNIAQAPFQYAAQVTKITNLADLPRPNDLQLFVILNLILRDKPLLLRIQTSHKGYPPTRLTLNCSFSSA